MEHLPGEDHTIDKPAAVRRSGASFQPPGWPGPLLGWTTVRPGDARAADPLAVRGGGRSSVVAVPPDPRPHELRRRLRPQRHHRRQLAAERLLVRPGRRRRPGRARAATSRPRGSSASACSTGCRPRRRGPTAASGYPGCACAATSSAARRTGSRRRPTCASRGGSGPSSPCSSSTSRTRCGRDGPELFADSVGVGCYRIDLHPARRAAPATSTSAAGRSRSRSAR